MIHCEKKPLGCQIQINGQSNDVVVESLYIIRSISQSCAKNSERDAEKYKKLMISAVLGLDGVCVFDTPSDSVCVDLSAVREIDRNGGDV